MTKSRLLKLFHNLHLFLSQAADNLSYRVRKEDFTRNRLLPFNHVAGLILSALKKSIHTELSDYFKLLGVSSPATGSAFSQARHKLKHRFFKAIINYHLEQVYSHKFNTRKGLRIIAVDGSTIFLPDNDKIKAEFPAMNGRKGATVKGRILCCYDVLNEYAVQTRLGSMFQSEKALMLDCLESFGKDDLLIYDRGFPSWDLIYLHQQKNIPFLMRCKLSFNQVVIDFVRSGKSAAVVEFTATHNSKANLANMQISVKTGDPLTVRLLRVELESGETEVLITSLMDEKEFPDEIFGDFYFQRWGVEVFFDRLKNKFQVEIFSGNSVESVYQDFYALIFLANIQSMICQALKKGITRKTRHRKYEYKTNRNIALGLLKPAIALLLNNAHPKKLLQTLTRQISSHLIPIRPGRSKSRTRSHKKGNSKHRHCSNFKRAI